MFVFVGIEGASVYSRYAKNRDDVGIATVLGFLGVLALLVLVTMLSYGILLRPELTALATPSMAGVLEAIVGPWGKVFISVGLLISVLGNYLPWSLLAAEVLHSAAVNRTMPSFLAHENARKVPAGALWLTNIVIQVFLLVTYFAEYAFTLALKMTSSMTLIPYLLVAAYGLKLAWTGETYAADPRGRAIDWIRSAIATIYAGRHDLRRRCKVSVAVSAALCARNGFVHHGETRAEEDCVYACRGTSVRSYPHSGSRRPVQSRNRHYIDLASCGVQSVFQFGRGTSTQRRFPCRI